MEKKLFVGRLGWGSGATEIVVIRAETQEEALEKLKAVYPGYRPYKSVDPVDFDAGDYDDPDIAYITEFG